MSADAIREAMARAFRKDCMRHADMGFCGDDCVCAEDASAALAALPITAAQLAEIAAGRAVVVPVDATEGMCWAATGRDSAREIGGHESMYGSIYRAMIAAAPREGDP